METHEQALLAILADHLDVTAKLLDHYAKLARAVRLDPGMAASLPAFEPRPTLQELHASTLLMQQRVRSILEKK